VLKIQLAFSITFGSPNLFRHLINDCLSLLPPSGRRTVETAKFSVKDTILNLSLPSHIVRGKLSGELQEGSLVCFGDPNQYQTWISKFFMDTEPTLAHGLFQFFDILDLRKGLSSYDLALCPVNTLTETLFVHRGWFIIPRLLDCVIDLRKPLGEIFRSRGIKGKIRRLQKFHYTFKVMNGELALEEFFHEMLLPTVANRHKETAYTSNLEVLKKKLRNGYLLGAYRNSEWVAADLVVRESNKTLRTANTGWRNGDVRLLKQNVSDALVFELVKRAKRDEFRFLNLGNNLPFVDDGVLNYKIRWGADPVMPGVDIDSGKVHRARGFIAVRFNLASKSGKAMLHHNPLLQKHKKVLRAIGWDSPPRPCFRRQIDRGLRWVDLAKT